MHSSKQPTAISASEPAKFRQAVVFCCDQNYLAFACLAATQIAAAHPDRDFDICLCSDALLSLPKTLEPFGLRLVHVGIDDRFSGLRLDARRTHAAYLRLALPNALAAEYDRLLYLDSDIFFRHGDLSRLLKIDMRSHAIAAVRDNPQWRTPNRTPKQFKRFGWDTAPYFNSGLLLIDTAAFNKANLEAQSIDFGLEHKDRLVGHDQTLLNCVLRGDWAELSPLWNWQFTWASRLFALMEDAHILHFIGSSKPWNDEKGQMPLDLNRTYADFCTNHFADQTVTVPKRPLRDSGRQIKTLLKHAASAGRTARYLDRFDGAYDVIAPAGSR